MSYTAEAPATSIPEHAGMNYISLLEYLHERLSPRTYLEIGSEAGHSLRLSKCPSISIDPAPGRLQNVFVNKPATMLFNLTSDEFFRRYSPTTLFGEPVALAMLDGMHLWEFLLRDLINTERHCARNSVIALHDCIPTDAYVADRDPNSPRRLKLSTQPGWWAGDVWKVVLALKKYRPDLVMYMLDAPPTGLVLLTNLDPGNSFLADNYFDLLTEFGPLDLPEYGLQRYVDELPLTSTRAFEGNFDMLAKFWP